jgi:hypothetical protein
MKLEITELAPEETFPIELTRDEIDTLKFIVQKQITAIEKDLEEFDDVRWEMALFDLKDIQEKLA